MCSRKEKEIRVKRDGHFLLEIKRNVEINKNRVLRPKFIYNIPYNIYLYILLKDWHVYAI